MTLLPCPAARLPAALALFLALAGSHVSASDRYIAWLADGTRLTANVLPAWPVPGVPYRFENQDLLASDNPVRLVRDRQLTVTRRVPFLVLANGDVLPGAPQSLAPDEGRAGQTPLLRVQLDSPLLPVSGTSALVRTDRVRRIVGSDRAARSEPPPGTVVLADGRQLLARSIRWREYGLALLTAEGVVEAAYGDLVDVVFPGVDLLAAVLDDNLWAGNLSSAASPASAIVRFATTGGAMLTAARISREMEQSRRRGRLTRTVYYYVQPAWADQPLAIPETEIAWCGYRAADAAPLSLLPAETLANRRLLGQAEPWLANRSAAGEPLRSGKQEADVGLLAHAHSEIAFDLPPSARTLSLGVGLANAERGCVRCKVLGYSTSKEAGEVLWDSGVFQGAEGVRTADDIDVAGITRVSLVAEYAHGDRPEGADPLDIGDQVVWLDPQITLDLTSSGSERLAALLPGAGEWEFSGDSWKKVDVASRWNALEGTWENVVVVPKGTELKLRRTLTVTADTDVLELLTACPVELDEFELELTADGQALAPRHNADRQELRTWVRNYSKLRSRDEDEEERTGDQLAYWWDLSPWRGKEVSLELVLRGSGERSEAAWRSLALRQAVAHMDDVSQPMAFDVPLTTIDPIDASSHRDRSHPQKNAIPAGRQGEPIRFLGRHFTGGYGLVKNSSVTFPLRPEFRQFVAIAGCCQRIAGPLQVRIDGRVAWERTTFSSLSPAEPIAVEIPAGAQSLTLVCGNEGEYGASAAFVNAGFAVQK